MRNYKYSMIFAGVLSLLVNSSEGLALNCTAAPDCASLGYTKDVSKCDGAAVKCPWDTTKAFCEEAATCNVENCVTCEAGKPDSCKVCADGYLRLTVMGRTTCSPHVTTKCLVDNCTKCVDGSTSECAKCAQNYTLNATTKKCDYTGPQLAKTCEQQGEGYTTQYCGGKEYCCPSGASCNDQGGIKCYMKYTDSPTATCPGGASDSSCACGGTHSGIGYTSEHHCL